MPDMEAFRDSVGWHRYMTHVHACRARDWAAAVPDSSPHAARARELATVAAVYASRVEQFGLADAKVAAAGAHQCAIELRRLVQRIGQVESDQPQ